jgi:PPOX class probable F420-dependent enzyme
MLHEARVAHLGLLDEEDRPRVLPVTFVLAEGRLWTAVDAKPKQKPGAELARVRFLRRRAEAALTVDRYDDDWTKLAWVQALGRVEIVPVDREEVAFAALCGKYDQYRGQPPAGPLLCLAPERVLCWRAAEFT